MRSGDRGPEFFGRCLGGNYRRSDDRRCASHPEGTLRAGARSYRLRRSRLRRSEINGQRADYETAKNFCLYSAGGSLYQDLNAVVNVLMFE